MRLLTAITALLGVATAAPSMDIRDTGKFSVARPGKVKDMQITQDNTLNGTYHGKDTVVHMAKVQTANGSQPFEFVNNFPGGQVNAYIVGLDSQERVVFLGGDGSLIYPSSGGSEVPVAVKENIKIPMPAQGSNFKISLPIPMHSGRIYFSEGELTFAMVKTATGDGLVQPAVTDLKDPSAGTNWGFVELTVNPDGSIYANISYVDFIGMILSMQLTTTDGSAPQITKGLDSNAVTEVCNGLNDQGNSDGRPWAKMCIANAQGQPLRVLSPNDYSVIDSTSFEDYWNDYVNQVWTKYTAEPLVINSQTGAGNVNCHVDGDQLNCDGDNRPYDKPTAKDIWGCDSGPFGKIGQENDIHLAVIPRLCAAFVRTTLLMDGGATQPSLAATSYYTNQPTNHYSRLIHEHEIDGKGYAFAYDDVNPDGNENASGVVSSGSPDTLTVYIGAPPA